MADPPPTTRTHAEPAGPCEGSALSTCAGFSIGPLGYGSSVLTSYGLVDPPSIVRARRLASAHLVGLGTRWEHTCAVARRAAENAPTLPEHERPVLIAAAWLHDIGCAWRLTRTGLHPIDGVVPHAQEIP